jgi:hypothetical protein
MNQSKNTNIKQKNPAQAVSYSQYGVLRGWRLKGAGCDELRETYSGLGRLCIAQ